MALLGLRTVLWQPSAAGSTGKENAVRTMVEEIEHEAAVSEKARGSDSNGRSRSLFSGPYADVIVVVETDGGSAASEQDQGQGHSLEHDGCEVRFCTPSQSGGRRVSDPSLPFSSTSLRSLRCKEIIVEVAVGRTVR